MGSQQLDILVVGGGVVGGGAALDAATRGLSVGLVEARDFASGTSSRSSKLIHGGLRYLEMLDFRLVAEALAERSLLLEKLAPHLVRPVPFIYPLTHRIWERFYAGSGVALYDSMAFLSGRGRGVPHHRHLTPPGRTPAHAGAQEGRPDRRPALLRRPGRRRPAHDVPVAHGRRVRGARRQPYPRRLPAPRGRPGHRCAGQGPRDRRGDRRRGSAGHQRHRGLDRRDAGPGRRARPVPRAGVQGHPPRRAARPHPRRVRPDPAHREVGAVRHPVGTALDHRHHRHRLGPLEGPPGGQPLRHRLPARARQQGARRAAHPRRRQGVFAGLRPLLAGEDAATSKLSREHAVSTSVTGLVVIAGGKYTTYRVMAKDAVDAAVQSMSTIHDRKVPRVLHRGRPAAGRRRVRGDVEPAAEARRRERARHRTHRAPAAPLRLARHRAARPRSPNDPTSASRWPAPTTTCAPRSSTPRRTRAPATSTTRSPAAPASPSRRSTVAPRSPPRSPS